MPAVMQNLCHPVNNVRPRSLEHGTVNPPRACRAGHPRTLSFITSSPGLTRGSIWRHPEGVIRGSTFQSTILTVENNGATRSLWHSVVNPPRARRAGGFSGQARE